MHSGRPYKPRSQEQKDLHGKPALAGLQGRCQVAQEQVSELGGGWGAAGCEPPVHHPHPNHSGWDQTSVKTTGRQDARLRAHTRPANADQGGGYLS